jgi:hypothetical protein
MDQKRNRRRTVVESLEYLTKLFKDRHATYGNAGFRTFGQQAFSMIGPIELKTPEDFGRLAILFQVIAKTARYSNNFARGGHPDSLDDAAVYAMMLQELDQESAKLD